MKELIAKVVEANAKLKKEMTMGIRIVGKTEFNSWIS